MGYLNIILKGCDTLDNNRIAPHETFDIQELLTLRVVAATKCSAMSKMVKNPELKSILQQDLLAAKEHISELQNLIQSSVLNLE